MLLAVVWPGLIHTGWPAARPPAELKLATWNLEWFMRPETLRALEPACQPADSARVAARRSLPCDVAHQMARSQQDIVALRRVARRLAADVIALQEVDGADAAALIFPDYEFCFSSRISVQNNGFAIRRGLAFTCGPDLRALSLDDQVRRGVELRLFPNTRYELRLLSVHLKSGCAHRPLDLREPGCEQLRAQLPVLASWIHGQEAQGRRFALLGDFNRDLLHEPAGPSAWMALAGANAEDSSLVNTALRQPFQNCSPAQTFSGYIDYLLLGRHLAREIVPNSFGRELFPLADALRRKLSDHCPVFVRIRVADAAPDLS